MSYVRHLYSLRNFVLHASVETKSRDTSTCLVVNPNSCSGLTGKNWDELYLKIERIFGGEIRVKFTERPNHGTEITRNLLKEGVSRIIAIGGDGTINEVVNGFFVENIGIHGQREIPVQKAINPDATIGIVPCGTRNVLAKSLGLPISILDCCRKIVDGGRHKIDLILASATVPNAYTKLEPRFFLNAAEIGLPAELITRSKMIRRKVKSRAVSTVAAFVATIPLYESNQCEFFIDGRKKSMNMTMGVVANGKFLGGGFMVAPGAEVNDGLLDLVVLKDSGSFKMLDELVNIKNGTYATENNILYTKAKRVLVKSKEREVTVAIDGEQNGVLPSSFQIVPEALDVLM